MRKVLVLGGAGFIGANIAHAFVSNGDYVTVIDGLFPHTGANPDNLPAINCDFCNLPVEKLSFSITDFDIVVDAMAWTSHLDALENPMYDLELNLKSHLSFIQKITDQYYGKIIYLGSRGQYGNPSCAEILEHTPMEPEDIQGVHKVAAESYYRIYSKRRMFKSLSIRFPNTFGPFQKTIGKDIGLIGSFIRDILSDRSVTLYGKNRFRNIVFSKDIADIVLRLSYCDHNGFEAYNVSGIRVPIENIIKTIIDISGMGSYDIKEMPSQLKAIDVGDAIIRDEKLIQMIGSIVYTPLPTAISETIKYFQEVMKK